MVGIRSACLPTHPEARGGVGEGGIWPCSSRLLRGTRHRRSRASGKMNGMRCGLSMFEVSVVKTSI